MSERNGNGHDPYPMQSEEARRLAASLEGGANRASAEGGDNTWNQMNMESQQTVSSRSSMEGNSGEDSLVHSKSRKKGNSENIYEDIDAVNPPTKSALYMDTEDEYLDQPLMTGSGTLFKLQCMLLSLHTKLYGSKLPPRETLRTLCLSSVLFFMIGGYWLLRSLKDPVLTALCGVEAIPKAKMLSVVVVLGVVSIYNRLLDNPNLKKHSLFYIFGMFYFFLFTSISFLLAHPTIGLANQRPDTNRILGWISYCSIESFGSVMVSLFWSFANSNFNLESAKASYGLLVATAQIGSILGPSVVSIKAESWGVPTIYFLGAFCILLLQACMYVYIAAFGSDETNDKDDKETTTPKKKKGAGVLEGLHLFVKHNYVKGIFAISCLFMVEVTIVDYTMKVLAKDHFAALHPCLQGESCWDSDPDKVGLSTQATVAMTTFMGLFGQATNTLSFFLSFFGTSAIIRHLGLKRTLLLFPSLCLVTIVIVRLYPTLYVVFGAMMVLKANSYALNNPTKEMLYQPTSSAVRYKAKSWIDIFGARGSKALGSLVTNAFSDSAATLVQNGSLVGMAVASFLIWNATYMGKTFESYLESGYIVGDDSVGEEAIEVVEGQNESEDTSCAFYEDDEIVENVSDNSSCTDEGTSEKGNATVARVELV